MLLLAGLVGVFVGICFWVLGSMRWDWLPPPGMVSGKMKVLQQEPAEYSKVSSFINGQMVAVSPGEKTVPASLPSIKV